ncbi:MAG TPA: fibronectin type III domain-containing protein [Bdellovibrio sp.]|uniref:fibronectin type III domain-containing protein n=1 Tax=Bdellovibrio sp. TaxID=28201 RepID=UPI002F0D8E0B
MKIFVSVLAFALTFAMTAKSLAEEAHHEANSQEEKEEHLSEKMNSLFPPKQPDLAAQKVPGKPELTSPAYFAAINGETVKLEWKAGEGAQEYHVQVATDPNFKWLVAEDHSHKETSFEVSKLEPGKHYFWRVASVRPDNWKTFRKSYFATSMFETPAAK